MLRLVALVALLGFCAARNSHLDGHWAAYKSIHRKRYSAEEDSIRRAVFEASVERINQHNLRHDLGLASYRMGLNKFADLTDEEFKQYKGFRVDVSAAAQRRASLKKLALRATSALPTEVDWRAKGFVTPVKNQKHCGSCWAFSTTGSVEGQHFAKTGNLVSLSEQNLVDCSSDYGNEGCNGGSFVSAFKYIIANGGIDTEESYSYTAKQGQCRFNRTNVGAKLTSFVELDKGNEEALREAVATVGPVSVGIDANHPSFKHYKSGVFDETTCSTVQLDHAVLAVGYGSTDDGKDYWLVKNSWSNAWGEEGYVRMSRNKNNQCGIASAAAYPIA